MTNIQERPKLRKAILNYCQKNGITIIDMYANFPCSNSIKKQLKKMLIEEDMFDAAKKLKAEKDREG